MVIYSGGVVFTWDNLKGSGGGGGVVVGRGGSVIDLGLREVGKYWWGWWGGFGEQVQGRHWAWGFGTLSWSNIYWGVRIGS